MVRATAAEIKKLFLGVWPPGVDDTNVGNILAGVDYKLDGFVKKFYKTTLSTTDTDVIHIANMLGKQEILHGLWSSAGGILSGQQEPKIFTDEIVMLIQAIIGDTSTDGYGYVKMQAAD